jgi:hypothetical protein
MRFAIDGSRTRKASNDGGLFMKTNVPVVAPDLRLRHVGKY